MDDVLVVVKAKSYTPTPLIREVTSTLTQLDEEIFPEDLITEPVAGALA
jgi:hypothetical protein